LYRKLRLYWDIEFHFETHTPEPGDLEKLQALDAEIHAGRPSALTSKAATQPEEDARDAARRAAMKRAFALEPRQENLFWVMTHSAPRAPRGNVGSPVSARPAIDRATVLVGDALGDGDLPTALFRTRGCAATDEHCARIATALRRYQDAIVEGGSTPAAFLGLLERLQTLDAQEGAILTAWPWTGWARDAPVPAASLITRRVAFVWHQRSCLVHAEPSREGEENASALGVPRGDAPAPAPPEFCAQAWDVAFPGRPVPALLGKPITKP
jgi:hypothetical protein